MSERSEPAFPQGMKIGELADMKGGLTKREYFAAKAMQGILSNMNFRGEWTGQMTPQFIAEQSFRIAGSMTEESDRTK